MKISSNHESGILLIHKRTFVRVLVWALGLGVPGKAALADDAENLARLRAMPVEQRKALAKNLERFDKLDRPVREAITTLDRQLAETDPIVRLRYQAVLRRYHLWLRTLPEEQRKKLEDAPPDQRLEVVARILKATPPAKSASTVWTQASALSPSTLVQQAYWIKIWFSLTVDERKEVTKVDQANKRLAKLEDFGRRKGILAERHKLEEELKATVDKHLPPRSKVRERFLAQKAQLKSERNRLILEEFLYIRSARPAPVEKTNLTRFANVIPVWIRESFDPLPPDAAESRLTLLYRMIYPEGQELPPPPKEEKKPAAGAGAGPSRPAGPSTPPPGGTTPF